MKTTRLLTAISGIALVTVSLLLSNGCGQKAAAPAPEGFKSPAQASAEPNSFNNVAAYLDAGGSLYLYLSTEQWLDGLSKKIGQWRGLFDDMPMDAEEHGNVKKAFDLVTSIVSDSGVEDISGFGMSSIAVEKGFYRTRTILHHYKGKGSGFAWTMFGKSAHALDGLDLAPTTTAIAIFGDLDVAQLWSVIQDETRKSGIPEAQQFLDQLPRQFNRSAGLDWEKTLASLGGEYGIILTLDESRMIPIPLPTSEPLEIPEPGLLIVAKVNDDTVFNRLEQAMTQSGMQVIRSEKSGAKMRTVAVPLPLPMAVRPTIALADGYLFIASSDALVEEALAVKGGKAGLKSSDEFKRLSKDIPSQGNQYSYVSKKFGQTFMKVQQQVMEMKAGQQEPGVAKFMQTFLNPENAQFSYCVGANTDEGWVSVANGNQNAALAVALVPVAVVGMLSAVAIPNFVKARSTAQKNGCINNLRQIDGAKEQWALEKRKNTGNVPKESDITEYMQGGEMPVCPEGGHYTIGAVGTNPRCSIHGMLP